MKAAEETIFIIDDDIAVRDSLVLLLSLNDYPTRAFASAEDFLAAYKPLWRGCLLLDIRMTGMDGLALQQRLGERGIDMPVVVISAHGSLAVARQAFRAGAVDFLEKPVQEPLLLTAIAEALARAAPAPAAAPAALDQLTQREREVLNLIINGLASRQIAAELGISPRTVEVYKSRMMEKLGVRKVTDLVRVGLLAG